MTEVSASISTDRRAPSRCPRFHITDACGSDARIRQGLTNHRAARAGWVVNPALRLS